MLLASHRAAIGLIEGVVVLEGLGVMVLGVLVEGHGGYRKPQQVIQATFKNEGFDDLKSYK